MDIQEMIMHSLTDQLSILRWEKYVDVEWVNGGGKVLITVGHSSGVGLQAPSIDLESGNIRVGSEGGGEGGGLPGDVAIKCAWVVSEPVEGAGFCISLRIRGLKSKAICDGWRSRLTVENSTDNAHVVGIPTRSQAKQARGQAAVRRT